MMEYIIHIQNKFHEFMLEYLFFIDLVTTLFFYSIVAELRINIKIKIQKLYLILYHQYKLI